MRCFPLIHAKKSLFPKSHWINPRMTGLLENFELEKRQVRGYIQMNSTTHKGIPSPLNYHAPMFHPTDRPEQTPAVKATNVPIAAPRLAPHHNLPNTTQLPAKAPPGHSFQAVTTDSSIPASLSWRRG